MMPNMRQRELKEVWGDPFNPVASPLFRECPGPAGALDPILEAQGKRVLVPKGKDAADEGGKPPARKPEPGKA